MHINGTPRVMKHQPYFITAIATPLHEDDTLHEEGLERLIA